MSPIEPGLEVRDQSRRLRALYATARSLTELAAVDDVLQSIVRHAYPLIATDLVYLTVLENGQRVIRAAEGTFSEEFRAAQLEQGVGIAGLVEMTLAPAWTADYFADDSFPHCEQFDRRMRLEGIVALLGVPLLDGGELRGVLFAGQRSPRSFQPDEIAMLSAFANHASVTLRNASLYQRSQDAVHELTALQEVVESTAGSLRRGNDVHDALTNTVLQGGGYAEVLDQLTHAVPGHAILFDGRSNVLACSDGAPDIAVPHVLPDRSHKATAASRVAQVDVDAGLHALIVDVVAAHDRLGLLVHVSERVQSSEDNYIIERCGQILAMLVLRNRAVVEAGQRARGELTSEILRTRGPIERDTLARANARGITVHSYSHSICVAMDPEGISSTLAAVNATGDGKSALFGEFRGTIVGLCGGEAAERAARVTSAVAGTGAHAFAVCYAPFSARRPVEAQLATLVRSTLVARSLGMTGAPVETATLTPYATVFDPSRHVDLAAFVEGHLGPLLQYDADRGTDLAGTVTQYFAQDASLRRTADALFIHSNTLVKRLSRVDELLGPTWRHTPRSTLVALACQLRTLVEQVDPSFTG
ncbi:GAF domain-containing protein [Streptomyces sp. SID8352]|uniref:helix-turn-helix domain-containing protein n=1 Tax=Streptomyces sp. SID8352 TaxID=2690338 RepID=UPI001369B055|nr:GAF domain-containing protein [Streptomyces sp. SID8352]MYU21998.1 GAF domain-containing protein [Streptomyces sp. SID8352]